MTQWQVLVERHDNTRARFEGPGISSPAIIGRGGVRAAQDKQESDGATPLGSYPLRQLFYRPDREMEPITKLPKTALSPDLGWCDAPDDPAYNRLVRLPYGPSHEKLWREDSVYDLILTIGHNDDPVVPGRGSAIFIHLQRPDGTPTDGCVALPAPDMRRFLRMAAPGDIITIKRL